MEEIIPEIQPSSSLTPVPNSLVISWPSQQMSLTWGKEKGNLIYFSILDRARQMGRQESYGKSQKSKQIVDTNSFPPFNPK